MVDPDPNPLSLTLGQEERMPIWKVELSRAVGPGPRWKPSSSQPGYRVQSAGRYRVESALQLGLRVNPAARVKPEPSSRPPRFRSSRPSATYYA